MCKSLYEERLRLYNIEGHELRKCQGICLRVCMHFSSIKKYSVLDPVNCENIVFLIISGGNLL